MTTRTNRFATVKALVATSAIWAGLFGGAAPVEATTFTTTVPGTSITLPVGYPEAGGVAIVMTGVNGNIYYQFSDPANAFKGFNNSPNRPELGGNPFTVNDPIPLDCGYSSCRDYFGGDLARVDIRFSAYDGDTQPGGFDNNDITLRLNGYDVGSWSGFTTERTDDTGTSSFGFATGFGNNTFNTGWFASTDPGLMNSLLDTGPTGQTTIQVFDRDPNDNYWDFQRGPSLGNQDIKTVAPGMTIEKTASPTTYTEVGDVISYEFVLKNIGSVPISNVGVSDDKISAQGGSVTCDDNNIPDSPSGAPQPFQTICRGTYTIEQADIEAEQVVNIGTASGTPESGVLGDVTDTATVTGPAAVPAITLVKSTTLSAFGAAGTTVPYTFDVENTGNVTLTDVKVTDPKIPSLSCTVATMLPDATYQCSGNYTVLQSDVDNFAAGTQLRNDAEVTADAATGGVVSAPSFVLLDGPAANPSLTINKRALTASYDSVGDIVQYAFDVRNTGNVTFASAPTITDSLGIPVTCPTGPVAPNQLITCTAETAVTQPDIDAGKIDNTATAAITVAGVPLSETSTATVNATRTTGLTMVKRLAAASPASFDAGGETLSYEYVLTNTGNVTLDAVGVVDDKTTVSCPATEIAPMTSMTCTATYETLQSDVNDGGVTNKATASGTPRGDAVAIESDEQTLTVPAVQNPSLLLEKSAGAPTPSFSVGSTITYTFTVTNDGNVDNAGPITITDSKLGAPFECIAGPLLVTDAPQSCSRDYTLTAQDLTSGLVVNDATASGDGVTSPSDGATVSNSDTPEVTLTKSASPSPIPAGTTSVTYTFTVQNTGTAQLLRSSNPITINDPKVGAVDCSAQPLVLNAPFAIVPGGSFDCTATYTLTQAEIDAGEVVNTATASFPFNDGSGVQTVTSKASTAKTPIDENFLFTFTKSGPAAFTAVNETLNYTFDVENTGNVTIRSFVVTDDLISAISCPVTSLAPTESTTCTGAYNVTQADVDLGTVLNTASVTGSSASGSQLTLTSSSTATRAVQPTDRLLSVDKTANRTSFTAVGQEIIYAIEVTNDGLQTLTNLTVTDILDGAYSCNIPSLAPGVSSSACTFTHVITQDDIDAGEVVNLATASGAGADPKTSGLTVPGPARNASFTAVKDALSGYTVATDSVTYRFTVTNNGNVRIAGVEVSDRGQTCTSIGTLEPGEVDTSCEFTFPVTQDDVDQGSVTNTATVTGTGADGTPLTLNPQETVNGPIENAKLTVSKSEDDDSGNFGLPGTTEGFTISVTNAGNVTLENIAVTDTLIGLNCVVPTLAPGATALTCEPVGGGAAVPMTGTYTIQQSDVDRGSLTNTATASGTSKKGTTASGNAVVELDSPVQTRSLVVAKTSDLVGNFDTVGQTITYNYAVTNNGNVTLPNAVSVSDDKLSTVICDALPAGGLAPNDVVNCTATYDIVQADIDRGFITNTASATTSSTAGTITSPDAILTINSDQNFALTLDKRLKSTSAASFAAKDETLTYEYLVTNSGNTTITDDITVNDDRFGTDLVCSVVDLAPTEVATCEQPYTTTQGDVNDGEVTNIAQAYIGPDLANATTVSNTDSVTVPALRNPLLVVEKRFLSATGPVGNEGFFENQELSYEFEVTNDGNVSIAIDAATLINDPKLGPYTCVGASGAAAVPAVLEPTESYTCVGATYTVTANDIDLGSAVNVATARGTLPDGGPIVSASSSTKYPLDASPAVSVLKRTEPASGVTFAAVGDTINYVYEVTNTGNVDLSSPGTITDDKFPGVAIPCVDPSGGVFSRLELEPAEIAICTQTYTVTQEDLDRGSVTNVASALTEFGGDPVQSEPQTLKVDGDVEALVALTKEVSPATAASAGDTLTYTLTATASGNQTILGASISDPLIPSLACTQGANSVTSADLDPNGDPLICTGTVTVTQAMIDNQEVRNTASVRGAAPNGDIKTADALNVLAVDMPNDELTVTKRISPEPINGTDPAYTQPGQVVTFVIEVENTGNITVDNIEVTDDLISGTCDVGTLAPGKSDNSCVFTITVQQPEVDAGSFTNTATATGTPRAGAGPTTGQGDVLVVGPPAEPSLSFNKSANVTGFTTAGETITYTFTVANTGNVTLFTQPFVTDTAIQADPFACGTIPAGGLAPQAFVSCTRDYIVTQADVDAGSITNTASVENDESPVPAPTPADPTPQASSVTINATRTPGVSLTKTPSITADAKVDDEIVYTYRVTNTGNVTLTDVTVSDTHASAGGSSALTIAGDVQVVDAGIAGNSTDAAANGVWDSLAPGDAVEFTARYTVTQADVDAKQVLSNTASVSTTSPAGTTAPTDSTTVNVPVEATTAAIVVEKTVLSSEGSAAGDLVTFQIDVRNAGNVTLDAPTLDDDLTRNGGAALSLTTQPQLTSGNNAPAATLDVGETWTYLATYRLEQADVDAGGIDNTVLVTTAAPDNTPVQDRSGNGLPGGDDSPTPFDIDVTPAISSVKTITSNTVAVDGVVTFAITVSNDGNVTLNSVNVVDTLTRNDDANTVLALDAALVFAGADKGSAVGTLLPGEVATYTGRYTLKQDDIDAGGISNSAAVSGTPLNGVPVTDTSDDGDTGAGDTGNDPTVLVIPEDRKISLVKKLVDGEDESFTEDGHVLRYEFVVTNDSNVTLTDTITITDALITDAGGTITCPAPPVAPMASVSCFGDYTVLQSDVDAGGVNNSATATSGATTSPEATLNVPAIQTPKMELLKEAEEVRPEDFFTTAKITYTYTVTNTGNVTIFDPITVTDNLIDTVVCPTPFPAEGIAPEGTYICEAEYEVTAEDVDIGQVTNRASASDGATISPTVTETIPDAATPLLEITKVAEDGATFSEVGDPIKYTFSVFNAGTRAFASVVTVYDDRIGEIVCFDPDADPANDPDFRPGETLTCEGTYRATQVDLDAGEVTNEAYAQTLFGENDTPLSSAPMSVTVDADLTPELSFTKVAAPNPSGPAGTDVTYTFTVTNTGNQTLKTVSVTDVDFFPTLSCSTPELLRGESLECEATYTISQDDVDAGKVENTATVKALTPLGTELSETATETTVTPTPNPLMSVVKSANVSPFGAVGTSVTYTFDVKNDGNVTLFNVAVDDSLDDGPACEIARLDVGTTDDSCTFTLEVTQEMVDAGSLSNTVNVTAKDQLGNDADATATITTDGPTRAPALEATKVANFTGVEVDDVISYTVRVENTGNVTLDDVALTDTMTRNLNGRVVTLDNPLALDATSDTDGDGRLDVDETWVYTATYTLTQADLNAQGVSNSVVAAAVGPDDVAVNDTSDNGNDGDGNTEDDKTVVSITSEPRLVVTKEVVSAGALAGEDVVFRITAANTGNVDIDEVTITDQLTRADGATLALTSGPTPVGDGTFIGAGTQVIWNATYTLTQDDIDAGGISNTATVAGTGPDDEVVSDISADNDPFDGDVDQDPTVVVIPAAPAIDVVKRLVSADEPFAGGLVEFAIEVTNTGNVSVSNVALAENLRRADDVALTPTSLTFSNATLDSAEGTLLPTEVATYAVTYILTQEDVDAGGVSNSVTVTATANTPTGDALSDVSRDDDPNDGNDVDDPTVAVIEAAPSNDFTKVASVPVNLFPMVYQVTFTLTATNTGNVTQSSYQIVDDLSGFEGSAEVLRDAPFGITVRANGFTDGGANAAYDGAGTSTTLSGTPTLAPGETGTVEIDVIYSTEGAGVPGLNVANLTTDLLTAPQDASAGVSVTDSDGDGVPDTLESSTADRDGDGVADADDYDPTGYFYCQDDGRILSGGSVSVTGPAGTQTGVGTSNFITIVKDGTDGEFQFFATRAGTYTITPTYPASGVASTSRLANPALDATSLLPANPASIGSSEFGATDRLADFTAGANPFYLSFVLEAGDPFILNNNIPMENCAGTPDLQATKVADRDAAVFGEAVNFSLTFTNNTPSTVTNATLVDVLPAGMLYTPNTARVDGALVEPNATGLRLEWPGLTVAPAQTITLTLSARVVANGSYGELTNRGFLANAAGNPISNVATATVRVEPEHVFDCSDIIGKVFDDKNQNGYQDQGEPGLAGVRLATVKGQLITTDAHGRYHVPCAELPKDIGSNFTLKLDTRTLPTGYRVTTENPRVIRVTAGKFAKLNFGAALSNVVDIDLTREAFVGATSEPSPALEKGVEGLIARIKSTPSVLRLSYILRDESNKLANARLKAVEALVRDRWRGAGRYKLNIERSIKRVQ
ncbi:DUF7507 domain-containing protein [Litoreibacter albidus]|uniref:Conserved repeat domain-containing protein n=1 Tax=Litoreibacter albidus TaxID=670155 RepID=A0A1H2XLT2_9RHOB|nr:DUF11 domain-containing protein [Litoreibacter albidus]SDW93842.1 conserved repeat domain-containing protein [Litoreibacter albidus]